MVKAVALFSGGLDSCLAIRVVQKQGVEVDALHFVSVFCRAEPSATSCNEAEKSAEFLGVPLTIYDSSQDLLALVKNPKHGYGKHLNPCIDCRINMFKKAAEYMRKIGAEFIITGEVPGQRPMSQRRHAMALIDKEAGVEELILRPLSAKVLEPTTPEKEGLVDREKLLAISGRSRTEQIALAEHFGIGEYPAPAGGCLLTYETFCNKLRGLMSHSGFDLNDVELLKFGRYYRVDARTRITIGRNQTENDIMAGLARNGDWLVQAADFNGPLTLVRGEGTEGALRMAAELTARYSQGRGAETLKVEIRRAGKEELKIVETAPSSLEKYRRYLII